MPGQPIYWKISEKGAYKEPKLTGKDVQPEVGIERAAQYNTGMAMVGGMTNRHTDWLEAKFWSKATIALLKLGLSELEVDREIALLMNRRCMGCVPGHRGDVVPHGMRCKLCEHKAPANRTLAQDITEWHYKTVEQKTYNFTTGI